MFSQTRVSAEMKNITAKTKTIVQIICGTEIIKFSEQGRKMSL